MRDRSSSDRARRCAAACARIGALSRVSEAVKTPKNDVSSKHAWQIRRGGSRQVQRCSTTMAAHVAAACSTAAVLVAASAGSSGQRARRHTRALVSRLPGRFFLRPRSAPSETAPPLPALGPSPGSAGGARPSRSSRRRRRGRLACHPGWGRRRCCPCAACAASFKKKASTQTVESRAFCSVACAAAGPTAMASRPYSGTRASNNGAAAGHARARSRAGPTEGPPTATRRGTTRATRRETDANARRARRAEGATRARLAKRVAGRWSRTRRASRS